MAVAVSPMERGASTLKPKSATAASVAFFFISDIILFYRRYYTVSGLIVFLRVLLTIFQAPEKYPFS